MTKQSAVLQIEETLGNITFYKTADGYLVKEKGNIFGNRIATDSRFQRTLENGEVFVTPFQLRY